MSDYLVGDPSHMKKWPIFKLTWIEDGKQRERISPGGDTQAWDIDCPFCDKLFYSEGAIMKLGDKCQRCGAIVVNFE